MHRFQLRRDREGGQALVLMTLLLMGMLFMCALVFDGANALANRRVLQNAADAGALAGANLLQTGTSRGCPHSGATYNAELVARDNLPDHVKQLVSGIQIACADSVSIRVTISGTSPSFFAPLLGLAGGGGPGTGGLPMSASATAMNGPADPGTYSVALLNPGNPSWPNGRQGCPSLQFGGGPTVVFGNGAWVNSACATGLSTSGSGSVTFQRGGARVVGGYYGTFNPTPLTGAARVRDPLAGLPPVPTQPTISNSRLVLSGTTPTMLEPGTYKGGIELKNQSVALLRPGIYVLEGGGLSIGAQSSVFSIGATTTASDATWSTLTPSAWRASVCTAVNCGVMIYNTSGAGGVGEISAGGGGTMMLRPYTGSIEEYKYLVIWQNGNPVPTSSYQQPQLGLGGGGRIDIGGTVYAPSAKVYMTGGSGGSGGDAINLTLQFVAWDLHLQGNASFTFQYNGETFARPTKYGLIQ